MFCKDFRRSSPGVELKAVDAADLPAAIDEDTAVVVLTEVHYKSARRWDMAALTAAAHAKGALILWDLSHSAGAVATDLNGAGADLAVGCGYKYLNGGPGAPAFLFVAERHQAAIRSPADRLDGPCRSPSPSTTATGPPPTSAPRSPARRRSSAWPRWRPGVDLQLEADPALVEAKGLALADLFIALAAERCGAFGVDAGQRPRGGRARPARRPHPPGGLRHRPGADGARRDRRLPRARHRCASASRRCSSATPRSGTPSSILHEVLATRAWDTEAFRARAAVT